MYLVFESWVVYPCNRDFLRETDSWGGGVLAIHMVRTSMDLGLVRTSFDFLNIPSCFLRKHDQLWFEQKKGDIFPPPSTW